MYLRSRSHSHVTDPTDHHTHSVKPACSESSLARCHAQVVYKIFTQRPVLDLGAFAPRDYVLAKQKPAKFYTLNGPPPPKGAARACARGRVLGYARVLGYCNATLG